MENPEIHITKKGIKIAYINSPGQIVHLGVTVLAGSKFEHQDEVGLAHFLEHCFFNGTVKRKSFQILSRLDSVGGELNAFTAKEEMCVYASCLQMYTERAIELIGDIISNSTFPNKEIQKEKEVVLDELISYRDTPSEKIQDDFEALFFKNHPYGNNILGNEDSIRSFTNDSLKNYIKRRFTKENLVFSFVGNIELDTLSSYVDRFINIPEKSSLIQSPLASVDYKSFQLASKEVNVQAHAMIGGLAPSFQEKDRNAMALLINVLGGPALNSKLALSIREKYGYVYTIEANYTPYVDTGYWSIYFGTDVKNMKKTLSLVYKEIEKLHQKPFTEKSLNQAKIQMKGHLALSLESKLGLMQNIGKSLLLFGTIDTQEEINRLIDEISVEDIKRVVKQYFDLSKISELLYV